MRYPSEDKLDLCSVQHEKVISIAAYWCEGFWHFVGECFMALSALTDKDIYDTRTVFHVREVNSFVLSMLAICFHFGLIAFSKRIPGITATRASWASVGGLALLLAALLAVALVPGSSFHSLD